MTFTSEWKKAKTTFETNTGKKKPSEKFWKVFNKSSGIEPALKDMDGAKKVDDLAKGIKKLESAANAYFDTLDRASKDEDAVPKAALATYREEVKKLEEAVEAIVAEAQQWGERLKGSGGKEKLDGKALQGVLEAADEHLNLRERMVGVTADFLKETKAAHKKVRDLLTMATKQAKAAKDHAAKSEPTQAQIAMTVVERCLLESAAPINEIGVELKKLLKDGSELMQSREDFEKADKLPETMQKKYQADSGKYFNDGKDNMDEANALYEEMLGDAEKLDVLNEEVEGLTGRMQPVEVYVGRLKKLQETADDVALTLSTLHNKTQTDLAHKEENGTEENIEAYLRIFNLKKKGWNQAIVTAQGQLKNIASKAEAIPEGVRDDSKVARALKAIKKARQASRKSIEDAKNDIDVLTKFFEEAAK